MRKLSLVLAVLLLTSAMAAHADSLVTSRPAGTDSVDWSQLGGNESAIPSPFSFTTANSVAGTGSYANPGNSYNVFGPVGAVMQEGNGWAGNFNPGDGLNWNENSGTITLSFAQGYNEIGAQIAADYYGDFTAQICDANGCFTENGNENANNDGSAIYIGISGSDITWASFDVTSASNAPDDFTINQVTLDAPPVPEPSSLLLFGTGLVGFAGVLRSKFARKGRA